jgi:hypothetical protein
MALRKARKTPKLWITCEKLWINWLNWGKPVKFKDILPLVAPPDMGDITAGPLAVPKMCGMENYTLFIPAYPVLGWG